MKTYKLTFSLFFFVCSFFYGQKKSIPKTTTYYSYDSISKSVKPRGCIKAKSTIFISEKKDSLTNKASLVKSLQGQILAQVIPVILNNISKLVYKPQKFAKSHGAKFNLIKQNKNKPKEFSHIINTLNDKNLTYARYCKNRKDSVVNLAINFSLHNLEKDTKFKILKLDNYIYNFTDVKLKNKHHKVNLLIQITVKSFDDKGLLQEVELDPIEINNAIPRGKYTNPVFVKNQIFRYIPIVNKIESISFTVNEVNARKKTWDKWAKMFDDNKDKIQSTIIEQINGEEEE